MNFNKTIVFTAKIYKLLEKFKKDDILPLDTIVDSCFPELLAKLQSCARNAKIALCSTNGKRTTAHLLNHILEENGNSFVSNVSSNAKKYPPITAIMLKLAQYCENADYLKDYFLMALDEFELAGYFNSIKFDYLLLGNLFNDQKDFCSLEEKRKKIQDAIILNSDCTLIINADEPMFYHIDEVNKELITPQKMNKVFYGFTKIDVQDNESFVQKNDILMCPVCSCKLDYKKRFYSHIGQYDCACGFRQPELDIKAEAKIFSDYSFLNVYYKKNKYVFKVPLGGVYNAYNALGAIATALTLGIERKVIASAFENYEQLRGRDGIIKYKYKDIKVKEIKNPVSLSESLRELLGNKNIKVVFALNDDMIDGDDTSWIWDSNFNSMKNFENRIYICSNRNDDMALRIKYSGVNPTLISMDTSLKDAIKCCFYELEDNERMIIFVTPSLVDEVYRILDK